jgi:hypothetical protein
MEEETQGLTLHQSPETEEATETEADFDSDLTEQDIADFRAATSQVVALRQQSIGADEAELLRRKALVALARGGDVMLVKQGAAFRLQIAGAERIGRLFGIRLGPAQRVDDEFGYCGPEDKPELVYQATYRIEAMDPTTGQTIGREGHADTAHGLLRGKNARDPEVRAHVRNTAETRAVTKAIGHLTGLLYISPDELRDAAGGGLNVAEVTYREGGRHAS